MYKSEIPFDSDGYCGSYKKDQDGRQHTHLLGSKYSKTAHSIYSQTSLMDLVAISRQRGERIIRQGMWGKEWGEREV